MTQPLIASILADIMDEMQRAQDKFGSQTGSMDLEWLAILAEEFGETAQVVTKTSVFPITNPELYPELRAELLQVAAVAIRWLYVIDWRKS